ncbi:TPA: hypothetical protein KOT48_003684 [Clostridioides difficile]|nr:hypothetical protein [Clostridioides difficile]
MDLKKLETKEKIKFILEQQEKGLSRKEISELFKYSKVSRLDDFMKRNNYIKIDDKFILNNGGQVEDKEQEVLKIPDSIVNAQIIQTYENQNKLFDIINNYDTITQMTEWFKSNVMSGGQMEDTQKITEIIEVNTGLQIDYKKSKPVKTTVRVDEEVWTTFGKLCENYSHLSKIDILSQCVYEFIKKYEK